MQFLNGFLVLAYIDCNITTTDLREQLFSSTDEICQKSNILLTLYILSYQYYCSQLALVESYGGLCLYEDVLIIISSLTFFLKMSKKIFCEDCFPKNAC